MSKRMMMPQNKREEIIFCAMCVMFMCAIMLSYNMFLTMGFTFAAIQAACMAYPLTCAVCFCLDFFVVCPIVQRIMRKIGGPWMMKKPWLGTVIFQLFTVTLIVILESFYGAIIGHGLDLSLIHISQPTNKEAVKVKTAASAIKNFFITDTSIVSILLYIHSLIKICSLINHFLATICTIVTIVAKTT